MSSVAEQYSAWPYPLPIDDLSKKPGHDINDLSACGPNAFPERDSVEGLDILIAGCGTNQGAWQALRNPTCRVVGIDFSDTSIKHETMLKTKHKLDNLTLVCDDLLNVGKLGLEFDYIVSSGVLHHLADPDAGLRALRGVLKPDGTIAIGVYSKHARFGIHALREAFQRIGLSQAPEDAKMVMDTLRHLPPYHPAKPITSAASSDLAYLGGVVDLCLHVQEVAYSVDEVFDYLARNDLAFQGWQEPESYWPGFASQMPIYRKLRAMEPRDRYSAMSMLFPMNILHSVYARRDDLDPSSYLIDFTTSRSLNYIPIIAPGLTTTNEGDNIIIKRSAHTRNLGGPFKRMFLQVDGKRTIVDIMKAADVSDQNHSRAFFFEMRESGDLMFRRPA